jgi:colanic acid biosynthesis glycosyl transferase WcaI
MRITLLTQYFPPEVGAAQVRLYSVARELQRRGQEVKVVTAMPNYPAGKILPEYRGRFSMRENVGGLDVIRTWLYPATGRNPLRRLLSYWTFATTAFIGLVKAGKPDLVLVESPPLFLGITGYLYARIRGARVVLNVSDLWPASARELGMITNPILIGAAVRLERFLYRHADSVTAVTAGIADGIRREAPKATILLLPNGVDIDLFRRTKPDFARPWIQPADIAFLYGGTHGYVSGLDVILDAAARLADHRDIVFVFVGDGADKARLQERAAKAALNNVRFVAAQPPEAMSAFFSASRASIVPLRGDEFFKRTIPAKIFPSLACSTPVIHCGSGDAAMLLNESDCGLVVPPERGDLLAEAVLRLAGDAALAERLGKNGRLLVEQRYAWEPAVGSWLDALCSQGHLKGEEPRSAEVSSRPPS